MQDKLGKGRLLKAPPPVLVKLCKMKLHAALVLLSSSLCKWSVRQKLMIEFSNR